MWRVLGGCVLDDDRNGGKVTNAVDVAFQLVGLEREEIRARFGLDDDLDIAEEVGLNAVRRAVAHEAAEGSGDDGAYSSKAAASSHQSSTAVGSGGGSVERHLDDAEVESRWCGHQVVESMEMWRESGM
jgi:hypothetical protein